jgi:hypothetical protein
MQADGHSLAQGVQQRMLQFDMFFPMQGYRYVPYRGEVCNKHWDQKVTKYWYIVVLKK